MFYVRETYKKSMVRVDEEREDIEASAETLR